MTKATAGNTIQCKFFCSTNKRASSTVTFSWSLEEFPGGAMAFQEKHRWGWRGSKEISPNTDRTSELEPLFLSRCGEEPPPEGGDGFQQLCQLQKLHLQAGSGRQRPHLKAMCTPPRVHTSSCYVVPLYSQLNNFLHENKTLRGNR